MRPRSRSNAAGESGPSGSAACSRRMPTSTVRIISAISSGGNGGGWPARRCTSVITPARPCRVRSCAAAYRRASSGLRAACTRNSISSSPQSSSARLRRAACSRSTRTPSAPLSPSASRAFCVARPAIRSSSKARNGSALLPTGTAPPRGRTRPRRRSHPAWRRHSRGPGRSAERRAGPGPGCARSARHGSDVSYELRVNEIFIKVKSSVLAMNTSGYQPGGPAAAETRTSQRLSGRRSSGHASRPSPPTTARSPCWPRLPLRTRSGAR